MARRRSKASRAGEQWQLESAAVIDVELTGEEPGTAAERPSRSARKRHAEKLQKLGVRLTLLRPALLQSLSLPETLLEAILQAQRLRRGGALARQRQYIGRLMRDVDPEPIERALDDKMPR